MRNKVVRGTAGGRHHPPLIDGTGGKTGIRLLFKEKSPTGDGDLHVSDGSVNSTPHRVRSCTHTFFSHTLSLAEPTGKDVLVCFIRRCVRIICIP